MTFSISSNVWNALACSYCGEALVKTDSGAKCGSCGEEYPSTDHSLDLRLRRAKSYCLEFELGTPLPFEPYLTVEPLAPNSTPQVDFSTISIPHRLSGEVLSYFPQATSTKSLMLDLGCGSAIHRDVCERAGFEWVGLDNNSAIAPILGDAHALPFKTETFDFVLSIAVLEHIRFPFVAMREVFRVLKPHGIFIGSVSFLEPFHGDSFYHHTHLGTLNSLRYGGFTILKLAPSEEWSSLVAQAEMALFPKMPGWMSRLIIFPTLMLHKLWWSTGIALIRGSRSEANRLRRITYTTGAFTFIAIKPGP